MARKIPARKKKKTFSSVRKIAVVEVEEMRDPTPLETIVVSDEVEPIDPTVPQSSFETDQESEEDDQTTPIGGIENEELQTTEPVAAEIKSENLDEFVSPFELVFEEENDAQSDEAVAPAEPVAPVEATALVESVAPVESVESPIPDQFIVETAPDPPFIAEPLPEIDFETDIEDEEDDDDDDNSASGPVVTWVEEIMAEANLSESNEIDPEDDDIIVEKLHDTPLAVGDSKKLPEPGIAPAPEELPEIVSEVEPEPLSSPTAKPIPEAPQEPESLPKVLVVHGTGATGRLIRETLENFGLAEVDTCPDAVYGFELALQRDYQLYIFALQLPLIEGPLLYELVCKAFRFSKENTPSGNLAPGIIFIREQNDPQPADDLNRDARVKGFLMKPLKIERMLQVVKHALPKKGKVKKSFFA